MHIGAPVTSGSSALVAKAILRYRIGAQQKGLVPVAYQTSAHATRAGLIGAKREQALRLGGTSAMQEGSVSLGIALAVAWPDSDAWITVAEDSGEGVRERSVVSL
jgi:hypothetical protein